MQDRVESSLTFFKPVTNESKKDVTQFLTLIVEGKYADVKAELMATKELIYGKNNIEDCSGRLFTDISGFEYALWAYDKHMWSLMLECVEQLPNDERQAFAIELFAQYDKIKNLGITYQINEKTFTEHHFNFEDIIIHPLLKQVHWQYAAYPDWAKIDKHWKEKVGHAQTLFPMHVVFEYGSDEYFDYKSNFSKQPQQLSRLIYNRLTKTSEDWFAPDSKLGVDFAIVKLFGGGCRSTSFQRLSHATLGGCDHLMAMRNLFEEKKKDFIDLEEQLKKLMVIDNHLFNSR